MMHYYLILLACLLAVCSISSAETKKWKPWEVPHPVYQHRECGRKAGEPSSICDPDVVISTKDADDIEAMIKQVHDNTRCCITCKTDGKGYVIMVAVIARMHKLIGGSNETRFDLLNAKVFSYYLSMYWNTTSCEELVLVLFSRDDDILYTVTWRNARKVLTDDLVKEIALNARTVMKSKDKKDIGKGLKMIVKSYSDVFSGKYKQKVP